MKRFAALYAELDAATATRHKQAAIQDYLRGALADPEHAADTAWIVYFLAGGKQRQLVATKTLRRLALELTGLPEWLFEESYQSVGDLAETLALLLPSPTGVEEVSLTDWMNNRLAKLRKTDEDDAVAQLSRWLALMPVDQRLVFFKLITGAFRVGVSKLNVVNALGAATGLDPKTAAQRMMGYAQSGRAPTASDFLALTAPEGEGAADAAPYPFFLAHPLQAPLDEFPSLLGSPADWLIEWKFDGIRAQLLKRGGVWRLWSRGEELIDDGFPEMSVLAESLPDGVALDGELVVVAPDATPANADDLADVAPFALMQRRIGRKALGPKLLRELPVVFIAYDLLEENGVDLRASPQIDRRARLETLVAGLRAAQIDAANLPLRLSPALEGASWPELDELRQSARRRGFEGMMLKARGASYGVGRRKSPEGAWWKWKLDPLSVDAVLVYAERGHGRRSGVYSDYTFALWDKKTAPRALVPFAKAYSGLTDEEMRDVDRTIRQTTVESFGPVRSVKPTMVFELGFEGVSLSKRHKSGVAVRFPRMMRRRFDKRVEDADTLATLHGLLGMSPQADDA